MAMNRLTFQEAMELLPLPSTDWEESGKGARRYMSVKAAWLPGSDIRASEEVSPAVKANVVNQSAFGAHVYCQSGIAAARALRETSWGTKEIASRYGIHTMHGYWSEVGKTDRPFIYEATPLATSPLFVNILVTARQPLHPSTGGSGHNYTSGDARLPLGKVCFSGLISFKPPEQGMCEHQGLSVQERFASILTSRAPMDWIPSPPLDIDYYTANTPRFLVGSFPAVDMRKVDMRAYNKGRPIQERRELILYRLIAPLAEDDPAAHVMVHAYETDRNGFLMFINHVGWGYEFGRVASLSNSIVVHTNPADTIMKGEGWWVQEVIMSRSDAGRGFLHCKIWSPEGKHIATVFQDGIFRKQGTRRRHGNEKL